MAVSYTHLSPFSHMFSALRVIQATVAHSSTPIASLGAWAAEGSPTLGSICPMPALCYPCLLYTSVHPGSLMGKRNFSEADECDLGALGHQTRDQFARVRPHSAEGVSRYQYAHRTPGMRGLGATLFLLGSSLGARAAAREGFSWPHAQLDSDSLLTGSREVIIAGLCAPALSLIHISPVRQPLPSRPSASCERFGGSRGPQ